MPPGDTREREPAGPHGRYGYYHEANEKHQEVAEEMKKQLRAEGSWEEQKLVAEIHPIFEDRYGWSESYLRNIMRGARKKLKEENLIDISRDNRGGIPAIILKPEDRLAEDDTGAADG